METVAASDTNKVDQAVIQIRKIQEPVNQIKPSDNEDAAKAMIAEQMEQNLKKLNIIIHNLKEPAIDLNGYQKKHADLELFSQVLSEINCNVNPEEDWQSGSNTPRPLLIGFKKHGKEK